MRILLPFLILVFGMPCAAVAQDNAWTQAGRSYDNRIPSPEAFLGYPIGDQHTRHDRLVEYFRELDRLSDRVSVKVIGKTFEKRDQILAIFTSPANHARREEIRKRHLAAQSSGGDRSIPLVIHLGYNVHGNEPSSSEAAMLTAFHLAASLDPETLKWLDEMVILMDPVINPDGRDRHTHWANMHKAEPPVADPGDREHNEVWPGGRTNHYWFDLNRDWFHGTFPETRNRIRVFHEWRPFVQTDHHEMGTNSTFYFDPGKNSSNNPIVPGTLYNTVYPAFGRYFSRAADSIGSMYFTKEAFDKLYPGYGSSYINFYGGAGFLFEQGSSRGHVQETTTIPLTFAFTIRNQFTASLTTIRASMSERGGLHAMRREFHRMSAEQAARSTVKAYVFGDPQDGSRTLAFVDRLLMHEVEVYELPAPMQADGRVFDPGSSYIVPVDQANHIMVRSLFEKQITYTDSTFYDASTWSLVESFGLPYSSVKTEFRMGRKLDSLPVKRVSKVTKSAYAYVIEPTDYEIHRSIHLLQRSGVIVQTAFRPFTATVEGKAKSFGYGSLSIPVGLQRIGVDSLYRAVSRVSEECGIAVHGLGTGYSLGGIDLGSNYMRTLKKPEAAMLIGTGVAATEAGEVWHLLDQRIGMPITKIDLLTLSRTDLARYNTLVMVSGNYGLVDKAQTDRIRAWVQAGGTLITVKTAAEWAIRNGFGDESLLSDSLPKTNARYDFDEASDREGAKAMGGSIFRVDLDTTHPIGFGYTSRRLSVYRNGATYLRPSRNAYSTVAKFVSNPLVGGYVHPESLSRIRNSASVLVGQSGRGRVVYFADDPNFRGVWYGTNRLFLNALFFGSLINVPTPGGSGSE
jgi:hypothetical protein